MIRHPIIPWCFRVQNKEFEIVVFDDCSLEFMDEATKPDIDWQGERSPEERANFFHYYEEHCIRVSNVDGTLFSEMLKWHEAMTEQLGFVLRDLQYGLSPKLSPEPVPEWIQKELHAIYWEHVNPFIDVPLTRR